MLLEFWNRYVRLKNSFSTGDLHFLIQCQFILPQKSTVIFIHSNIRFQLTQGGRARDASQNVSAFRTTARSSCRDPSSKDSLDRVNW